MARDHFIFHRSYFEAVSLLPARERTAALLAICAYALNGEEPSLTGGAATVFNLLRSQIDISNKRSDAKTGAKQHQNTQQNTHQNCHQSAHQNKNGEKKEEIPPCSPLSLSPEPPISYPPIIPPKEKEKRFTPPSAEEVAAYCKERENDVDPQRFVDFYTAKGWLVGKTKMKDWKAAVRTWERTNSSFGDNRGEAPKGKEEVTPAPRHTFVRTGEWEGYWVDENGERIE